MTEPKSVIDDSDQIYRNRSSRKLFIFNQISAMKLSMKKRGTFHEPRKYNFLLLIIFYLLSFSHNLMRHKNEQGESISFLPTKSGTLLIRTVSSIGCENRESNYHIWGNSKYRNVCQVTKSLLLATNILWGSSKYQNVCKFTKLSLLAINMIWSNSTQPNTYVSNIAQMQPRPLPSTQGISS